VALGEIPELTHALRAFGSARRGGGALQSQFFRPLVEARRKAEDARSADACLRAFDPAELGRSLDRTLERIVAEWPDARLAARRAVRAEMTERVAPYTMALHALAERAAAVLAAAEASRLPEWRAWTVQLAATFEAADRSWIALTSLLAVAADRNPR